MEATDTGLWFWDLITNEVKWSAQAYQQLGYQPDEFPMSLERFQQLMHPEDFDGMMSAVNQRIEQHQGFDVQFRLLNAAYSWASLTIFSTFLRLKLERCKSIQNLSS